MKQLFTILALCCITTIGFSQVTWTGGGDGHSWNDGANWDSGTEPQDGEKVQINSTVTVDGTANNTPAQVKAGGGNKTVTLDLDINIGDGVYTEHGLLVGNKVTLNIAAGRTITINVPNNKDGIAIFNNVTDATDPAELNILATATIQVTSADDGLVCQSAAGAAIITIDGTLNVTGADNGGINHQGGSIVNNGTITIGNTVSDGVKYQAGADAFTNNGTLTITEPADDGLALDETGFVNNGTITITCNPTASSGQNGILVGATGDFVNNSGGIVNLNGGASTNARTLSAVGPLNNFGTINANGGNTGRVISNDGGTITNEVCGTIFIDGGRMNNNMGTFINNGYFKMNNTVGGNFTSAGTATNNAFINFTNGGWNGTDNGVDVSSGNFTIDAMSSCAVADVGIDAAYTWFKEAANTTQAGTNDVAGALTLDNGTWAGEAAGTKVVYSCFGAEFTMTINNVDGGCLPVEMMYFNGEFKGEAVVLEWATASELNNTGFEVQRSADGLNWDILGFVNGNGTTIETQTYTFVDDNPLAKNYYRLKQMDYNDTYEYSNTITVNVNVPAQPANALVYPNPTSGTFNIEVENIETSAQITIFNNFGQLVKTVQLTNQTTAISLDEFANGTYYIQILNGENAIYHTIIKQ